MSTGFVYVMINPGIPKQVKIGFTTKTPDDRKKSLRATGIPEDFIVVYDELVTNCEIVEKRIHERFKENRTNPNREFFYIPVREAIRGVIEESRGYLVPRIGADCGVEILPDLKKKYQNYLRPDFHSVKIIHIDDVVFLETIRLRHPGIQDEIIERTDLSFIGTDNDIMFPSSRSPIDNARIFIHQLDEFSIINCTELFTEEAVDIVIRNHSANNE